MTRKRIYKEASNMGCAIDESRTNDSFIIDAPKGKIFTANNAHCIAVVPRSGEYKECWKDAMDRLSYGIEKCEDPHCELCLEGEGGV